MLEAMMSRGVLESKCTRLSDVIL
ncbi:hypothetical protein A2U01_0092506, partial [Trifolium medium]|nr:hypothetical protein [Trifolium medium]